MADHAPLLALEHIGKVFRLYPRPADRLWEALRGDIRHSSHAALDDISLDLYPGQAVGILGENGAGKSTLLKIVAGVLLPDTGTVHRRGTIAGLLELGTGFDERLSGLDNIATNARLLGLTAAEIDARRDAIIAFAELEDVISAPLRTYSTGMVMRLAFAVAIHTQPACFVVDEALSVGDVRFQQKCLNALAEHREQGGALLFVSHDSGLVKRLCTRALVLSHGRALFSGEPNAAAKFYQRLMMRQHQPETSIDRFGIGDVRVEQAVLMGEDGVITEPKFSPGDWVDLRVDLSASRDRANLALGFMIQDRFGQDLYGTNTTLQRTPLTITAGERLRVVFRFRLHLGPGEYIVNIGLHDARKHYDDIQDWWNESIVFQVLGHRDIDFAGLCYQPVAGVRVAPAPAPQPAA